MSKKTHQRELERARAKRQAEAYAKRQQTFRYVAIALIVVLAGGAFALAAQSGGGDDDVAADAFLYDTDGDGVADSNTQPDEVADDPATDDEGPDTAEVPADACQNPSEGAPESPRKSYDSAPDMVIDTSKTYVATIETTCGTIVVELAADRSPNTVNNFVFLARDGYYDGAPFHRVIEGFMIQGGDPSGTGHGEGGTFPGYRFEDELEMAQEVGYPRGVIAMANSGPDTNGSQFFIMHADYNLPPDYAVFGQAVEGLEVVDKIVLGPVAGQLAVDPVRIISVTIEER